MIIYFTGQPSAGKTTLANAINNNSVFPYSRPIVLDGDELREMTSNKDYSEAGRRRNLEVAHAIALFLVKIGYVPIIAMVSPFRDLREQLKARTTVVEFHVETSSKRERHHFHVSGYQPPLDNFTYINTDVALQNCVAIIKKTIHNAYNKTPIK